MAAWRIEPDPQPTHPPHGPELPPRGPAAPRGWPAMARHPAHAPLPAGRAFCSPWCRVWLACVPQSQLPACRPTATANERCDRCPTSSPSPIAPSLPHAAQRRRAMVSHRGASPAHATARCACSLLAVVSCGACPRAQPAACHPPPPPMSRAVGRRLLTRACACCIGQAATPMLPRSLGAPPAPSPRLSTQGTVRLAFTGPATPAFLRPQPCPLTAALSDRCPTSSPPPIAPSLPHAAQRRRADGLPSRCIPCACHCPLRVLAACRGVVWGLPACAASRLPATHRRLQ